MTHSHGTAACGHLCAGQAFFFFFETALMLVGKPREDYAVERKYINFKTLWLRYSCSLPDELPVRLVSLKVLQTARKLEK